MLTDKIGYLRQTDIFAGMPEAKIDEISSSIQMTNYTKGRTIFQPGDEVEKLFILKKGRVRIYRISPDGRELTLAELEPGTIFGEMALFGQTMYENFAQVVEDSLICTISRREAVSLLKNNPQIALRLAEILGRRLIRAENHLENLGLKDVPRRLASILLELADQANGKLKIDKRYTHEELAKMIGTSRESVTLSLGRFRAQGWLTIDGHIIAINDPEKLRVFINF